MNKKWFTSLLLGVLLISFGLQAQEQHSIKWQETSRVEGKKALAFTDTLYLNVPNDTSVLLLFNDFGYPIYKGNHQFVYPDQNHYELLKKESKSIVVKDQKGIKHFFQPTIKDQSQYRSTKHLEVPLTPLKKVNEQTLSGRWTSYKRQRRDKQPIPGLDPNKMLRVLEINTHADSLGVRGYGYFSSAQQQKANIEIKTIVGSQLRLYFLEANKILTLNILKLDAKEMIAEGDDEIIYYFRRW